MSQKLPFREHHLFTLLKEYEKQTLPLDLFINKYFREHKALGSKDRGFVAEQVYALIRWKALLDYLIDKPCHWEQRYKTFSEIDLRKIQKNHTIPLHVRVSFPLELFKLIESSYDTITAAKICLASNNPAPTVVRANTLKISREDLVKCWEKSYEVSPTKYSKDGIIFHKKMNFFELPEFKSGYFEVQDEGSQLLAQLVKAKPGDAVLDFCAGSGGKTLAIAPNLHHKGQIYLHDIRAHALLEARKRLKRAGIQNGQILKSTSPNLAKLKKKMDWVLVDAPCSGTGTLRRNPDMKWKFSEAMLTRLIGQQRIIFEKALSFLKPDGRIVYGTCSILKEENQNQLAHFIQTYHLVIEGEIFQSIPAEGEMDGFFGVVLKRA